MDDLEEERRPIELTPEEFWRKWAPNSVTPKNRADFMVDLERVLLTRKRGVEPDDLPPSPEQPFIWTDSESIVVERVRAIAVYKQGNGDIVIRQESLREGIDSVVVVPARYAYTLLEGIKRQLSERF